MKRSLLAVLLGLSLTSSLAWAAGAGANDASQMANVEAVMARSHAEQTTNRMATQEAQALAQKNNQTTVQQQMVTKGQHPVAQTPAPTRTMVATTNSGATKELEDQLTQINQTNLMFQQSTDQRIQQLNAQNQALQDKISKLTQAMGLLNQQLQHGASATVGAGVTTALGTTSMHASGWQAFQQKYSLYVIILLMGAILLLLIPRRQKLALATNTASADEDTKDEYDFMNSNEAIPAKLDLARAYVAMEDYPAAHKVLKEVTDKGTAQQQKEAKKLLDKIPDEH